MDLCVRRTAGIRTDKSLFRRIRLILDFSVNRKVEFSARKFKRLVRSTRKNSSALKQETE
ncbi:hypothetical protein DLM77_18160 [Leptospira yasudae]|uniref:Uncharacterized protein n=1 Tax=Leptospira yasudae TaxID=2202201 RepID=A0ABX9M079_9LEPT|nr:hypothetical protein DLM77_18160 [Leptospira yasudae]